MKDTKKEAPKNIKEFKIPKPKIVMHPEHGRSIDLGFEAFLKQFASKKA